VSDNDDGDGDWFESALEDDVAETPEDTEAAETSEDTEAAETSEDTEAAETSEDTEAAETSEDTEAAETSEDTAGSGDSTGTDSGSLDDDEADGPFETDEAGDAFEADEAGDAFEADEAGDAFEADEDGGAFGGTGGDSAFGEDEESDPFGAGESDDPFDSDSGGGDSVFDEDFESAFGGDGGDEEFADDEVESDIPRVHLGIDGLDQMIQGGVPERHLMTAIGSAGTGKTTFGLQFLYHGLQQGDKGVFITLEQSREEILATANEWGWDFDRYEDTGHLVIVDLDPVEMANSLDNIRGELPELIKDFGADRLVLDSVSLLEMMYEDQARRRTEVFDFTRSLKQAGVTTFLTSEASESNPYASRHGIIEYLTDAVFVLQYVRDGSQEARLAVEIQKIRNTNHSREMKPYEITTEGLSVYQQANIF
jgi:circadian clock protein KaiC